MPYQQAPRPPMTDDLARRCERAVHVITPEGAVLSAGRASLYVMDAVGWRWFAMVFSTRPLLWLVEAAYRLVAANRQWLSLFFFRPEPAGVAGDAAARDTATARRLIQAVCIALAAGLLLSPKLWLSSRSYPLLPVWDALPAIPYPLDHAVHVALIVLCGAACLARSRLGSVLAAILFLAVVLGLLDQSRWQPWFYQDVFMLGALALSARHGASSTRSGAALNTCRLIVASVYLWSGLHKINRSFVTETFVWFLQGFSFLPPRALPAIAWLGLVVPIVEAGTGIALLTRRLRRAAIVTAVLTHLFILAALGPLGRNVNQVVWVWNLAMIAFVVLLFRAATIEARDIVTLRHGAYHTLVIILFSLMPALSFVYLWDSYLSFAVYSANVKTARMYLSDRLSSELPAEIRRWVRRDPTGRNLLDHVAWSSQELRVPVYPQGRIYRGLARHVCRYATAAGDVELLIEERSLPALVRTLTQARIDPHLRVTRREDCGALWKR